MSMDLTMTLKMKKSKKSLESLKDPMTRRKLMMVMLRKNKAKMMMMQK
jgi:hypothetical protein